MWEFPGGPVAKTRVPNAEGLGLIPHRETRSRMLQWRVLIAATEVPVHHNQDVRQLNN